MNYSFDKLDGVHIISFAGGLSVDGMADEVLNELSRLIANGERNFVIDLSKLEYIDSTGLGLLLTCLTKSRNAGGDVVIASLSDKVKHLLVITKLSSIFTTTDTVQKAIDSFN